MLTWAWCETGSSDVPPQVRLLFVLLEVPKRPRTPIRRSRAGTGTAVYLAPPRSRQ